VFSDTDRTFNPQSSFVPGNWGLNRPNFGRNFRDHRDITHNHADSPLSEPLLSTNKPVKKHTYEELSLSPNIPEITIDQISKFNKKNWRYLYTYERKITRNICIRV